MVFCSVELKNIIVMGLAFFFIIGGYGPVQTFASTLLNFNCLPLGEISIGVVYLFLAIGSLVAPCVIRKYGISRTMWISSICYGLFCISVTYIILPVVLVAAAAIGVCGAFLNISQGSALAFATNSENHGRYSGIFNAFNQGSIIPGNVIAMYFQTGNGDSSPRSCNHGSISVVPGWNKKDSPLFLGCACCCFIGTLVIFFGYTRLGSDGRQLSLSGGPGTSSLTRLISLAKKSSKDRGLRLVVPLFFYSGISAAFWSGMFSRQMDDSLIPKCMLVLGGGEVIGSLILGWLVDMMGRSFGAAFIVLTQCFALLCALQANSTRIAEMFYAAAALLGIADSATYALCYTIISSKFGLYKYNDQTPLLVQRNSASIDSLEGSDDAFSLMMFSNSVAMSLMFFTMPLAASSGSSGSSVFIFFIECASTFFFLFVSACLSIWDFRIEKRNTG